MRWSRYNLKCLDDSYILHSFPFLRRRRLPGLVNQNDEDMSELVPVLLAQGKKKRELDLKDPASRRRKENNSRLKDTGRKWNPWWKTRQPGFLFYSRGHVFGVPAYRTGPLQPRPVLTLRTKDDGTREVKCRCTLQGFKDSDVLDLVRDRKTKSPRCLRIVERWF